MNVNQVTSVLGATLASASGNAKLGAMYPLFKWQSSDSVYFKPWFTTSGTTFSNLYYQNFNNNADRMFWPALTSSGTSSWVADSFIFNGVTFSNIQCYAC